MRTTKLHIVGIAIGFISGSIGVLTYHAIAYILGGL